MTLGKKLAGLGSGLALVLIVGALLVYRVYPLELAELQARWDLWREGVATVESAGLHGYVQDRCSDGKRPLAAKSNECTCVAMVHGLADSAMTWKKILLWPSNGWLDPVKLYAFDLPGAGGTPVPPMQSDYRVRLQAKRLKDALAPLCKQWMIVGNSLGGWVATWLALDWPEGVSRLILVDSAGLKATANRDDLNAFTQPSVETLKDFQRRAYYKGRPLPDTIWTAAAKRMATSHAREIIEAQTDEDFVDARAHSIRRPTLILWGVADQITPISAGRTLQSLIPGSSLRELPECGHLPQKECPLEVIKAIGNMIGFGAA